MDYNNFARIGGKKYNTAQTRSDTFYVQNGKSRTDELGDWIELIKSQNTQIQKPKEKFAWKTKAPLPEIGESTPRVEGLNSPMVTPRKTLKSRSMYVNPSSSHDAEENFMKQSPPIYGYHNNKRDTSLALNQGLMTRSMDVFPSHIVPKKTRLRPLGMDHLTVVPEARGASAFHHLPPMAPDIPERPSAPTPQLRSMDYRDKIEKKAVIEIPGYTLPKRINTESPEISPFCPASTPDLDVIHDVLNTIDNNEDKSQEIPKLDLHKLSDTPEKSSKIAQLNEDNEDLNTHETENVKPETLDNKPKSNTLINRPYSARKRRSTPFIVPTGKS